MEERTREAVATAEREQEVVDRRVVRKWLSQEGFTASDFVMVDREPPAGRLGLSQVLAIVPVESWSELVISVQNWPPSEREELSGAAVVMPVDGDLLIPLALRVFGNSGSALPVTDETVLADASVAAEMQLLDFNPLSTVVRSTVDSLIAASRERVREAQRDQNWQRPPRQAVDPLEMARNLRAEYKPQLEQQANGEDNLTGATVLLLLELCEVVADEDGRQIGLAASLASIDVGRISETSNHYVQLLDAIMALGLFTRDPSAG